MSANAWAYEEPSFNYHTNWYNRNCIRFGRLALYAFHLYDIYNWYQNRDFYRQRFEQSSFVGAHYLATIVPVLELICLAHLWMRRKSETYGAIGVGANFVQLAIVPLPYLMDYHVEWVTQMLKIISILAFVADNNIKSNNGAVVEGTPSYGIFIVLKVVPLLVSSVFVYRFANMLGGGSGDNAELSLLSLISLFWVISFFHIGYECPIYALIGGILLGWFKNDLWKPQFSAEMQFLVLPMITYIYAAGLSSHPFKKHVKTD